MSFIRKRTRDAGGIDVSPMLDMVFILLIFFIVTSTFTRETGVDVTKPKASSSKELAKESILIGVTRQGTIHINESFYAPDRFTPDDGRSARPPGDYRGRPRRPQRRGGGYLG